jgi:glycosyltransferase involved in cell wall biosynthesis
LPSTRTTHETSEHRNQPRPVTICFLIGSLERCGTAIHLLAHLRHLDRSRFHPWVVGLGQRGPLEDAIRDLGIEVHGFSLKSIYSPQYFRLLFWLIRKLRRSRTGIVQSYLFLDNLTAAIAAKLAGVPVVITGRRTVDDWESPRHIQLYKATNRLVDRVAVVSEQVAESVRRLEGLPDRKIILIKNHQSVETLALRNDPGEAGALEELERKTEGCFVFGTVGNVRPIKGHDVLVRALAQIKDRHPKCHLVVVGRHTNGPPYIERLIEELGLGDRVHLVGPRASIGAFLERFSAFVLPSLAEGMSNALLEALLLGKPAISTRFGLPIGSAAHPVVLSVEPGDVAGLAEAMERILTDSNLRESLAEAAREYCRKTMDVTAMVKEYEDLYEELTA